MSTVQHPAATRFLSTIAEPAFPCVGAKSALSRDEVDIFVAGDIRSAGSDVAVVSRLQAFAQAAPRDAVFVSQVILFPDTPQLDEVSFEKALWQRLRAFHALDRCRFDWDPEVSDDPDSPHFSMSLGGRAFYVIGLHPGSGRPARRFDSTALVFNLHSQFEALRQDGRYEKLRDVIIGRDVDYAGSPNPMLAVHGTASEARQYSGRAVDADWRCPFSGSGATRGH